MYDPLVVISRVRISRVRDHANFFLIVIDVLSLHSKRGVSVANMGESFICGRNSSQETLSFCEFAIRSKVEHPPECIALLCAVCRDHGIAYMRHNNIYRLYIELKRLQ